MEDWMKKCPKCAEDIKAEAIVCKHCGADLSGKSDRNSRMDDFVTFFLANSDWFVKNVVEYESGVAKFTGPKSSFSFVIFILLMFAFWLGILYLIYHWVKKPCFVTVKFDESGWPLSVSSTVWDYSYLARKFLKQRNAPDSVVSSAKLPQSVSPVMAIAIIFFVIMLFGILPELFWKL